MTLAVHMTCFDNINFHAWSLTSQPISVIKADILSLNRMYAAMTGTGWLAKGHKCEIKITQLYLIMIFNYDFNLINLIILSSFWSNLIKFFLPWETTMRIRHFCLFFVILPYAVCNRWIFLLILTLTFFKI